ncbi:hypothetical protein [Streptomyces apocyni]|uniref:hypothetical protein n=1 Tax=Streptomyces apocyni TaxID=2654677 RepID=UPI001E445618|nr:hypothetical protein [Streptomyces apocyni]
MTMDQPYREGTYVAHTGTDVYGPGKVLGTDGELRRVRFTHFVATIHARDLRAASPNEKEQVEAWLQQKAAQHGGRW